ncbi:MAG TPA: universal stress protein [Capillimicrobium sp.]|nr:universal stress protein [Capillimicrobium sp.]
MSSVLVVGVDGRDQSRDAVALGAALASASGGELVLAHVVPYDPLAYSMALGAPPASPLHDEADEMLREAAQDAPAGTRTVVMPASSPPRGLHLLAEREDARAVVVGSTHRGAVGRVMLGSHTEHVVTGSPCAVAVAPKGLAGMDWSVGRIAVAFDGEPESREALHVGRELASASGARLLLCAVAPGAVTEWSAYTYTPDWTDVQRRRTQSFEEQLAAVADGAETEVRAGDVVEELVDLSRSVDLLVLGSRAYGPVRRVLLGSTSHRLVREAHAPVLVVPRSAIADATRADQPSGATAGSR